MVNGQGNRKSLSQGRRSENMLPLKTRCGTEPSLPVLCSVTSIWSGGQRARSHANGALVWKCRCLQVGVVLALLCAVALLQVMGQLLLVLGSQESGTVFPFFCAYPPGFVVSLPSNYCCPGVPSPCKLPWALYLDKPADRRVK